MGRVERISNSERAAAISAANRHMDLVIGEGTGFVSPNARVGSLSDYERFKLVEAIVGGWIVERSRQLTQDRLTDESFFLATGEVPEPMELGVCAVALPALGDLVEKLGLTDKPIGAWSKNDILLFVWTAAELVNEARTAKDERPGPVELTPELQQYMAG